MKRAFAILVFVGLAISLTACEQEQINPSNTTTKSTDITENATDTDIYATEILEISTRDKNEPIPIYPPQNIKMDPDNAISFK